MSSRFQINTLKERAPVRVFVLNGVPYLPHYRNADVFVGPGYGKHNFIRYTAADLWIAGATPEGKMLWARGDNGIVDERNP
jgi:hypothetical protein